MGIAVLGPLVLNGGAARLAPRDRVVLEALALRVGMPVSADQLADALWPVDPPATWSKVVQGSVVRLRRELGHEAIETVPGGYQLVVRPDEVDARRFERLVGRAREQLTLGEPERASYTLGQALALWRGRALADLDGWDEGRIEAGRLDELRRDAEELRVEAALQTGHHRDVLAEAQTLVEKAPLRERRWELLALAQYQAGRQGDALRTLRQAKKVLIDELGLEPGPGLLALQQAILRQDPSLLADTVLPQASASCPYLGLVAYDVDDADAFFGRDAVINACLERLTSTGVVAVVGPSGSGKSSLVRAGVAAALRRDGSRIGVITPGAHPMDSLTAVPSSGNPVLVVDQCEEAVSLCDDPEERAAFFSALSAHAQRGRLVIALRADRLGDLAGFTDIAGLVERGLFLLHPMSEADLRAAIEGPARQAGLLLEPGLVELLIQEVAGEPGALPLLSHALRETWALREGSMLTVEGYRATGGIQHAIADSAESLYEQVTAAQRPMLRDLLLRLITSGPDGEPVRSRLPRRLVAADPQHEHLLEMLVDARLVTSDDGVLELAHEAVARAWPRLRGWLDEDTDGQRILRHLTIAADNWHTMGRPDSELYRGSRLTQALEWQIDARPELTPTEGAFLDAGRRFAEREELTAAQRARVQARSNRRLRGLLAGAAFLLVAAAVAGSIAVGQANRATDAARFADAQRIASQSQQVDQIDHALQLALASLRLDPSAGGRASLLGALARSPAITSYVPAVNEPFWQLDVSDDGETVAVMDLTGRVYFYDPQGWERVGEFDPHPPGWATQVACVCDSVAFSPDGQQVAVAVPTAAYPSVRLLDTGTQLPVEQQLGGLPKSALPEDLDYSTDGRFLSATFDHIREEPLAVVGASAYVWDLTKPDKPIAKVVLPGYEWFAELSPDGSKLYALPAENSDQPPVGRVIEVSTGKHIGSFGERGHHAALSPDGSTIAYDDGNDLILASSSTGREIGRLEGLQDTPGGVVFSPDGTLLAAASGELAVVWRASTGRILERLPLGSGGDLHFSSDGQQLMAVVEDGLLSLDLDGGGRFVRRTTPPAPVQYGDGETFRWPSPDGDRAAVTIYHGDTATTTTHVVDLKTGGWVTLDGVDLDMASWRPDGRRLVVVEDGGWVRVVGPESGDVLERRRVQGLHSSEFADEPVGVWYTPDGTRLLAETDRGVVVLDADTLQPMGEPTRLPGRTREVLPGPTGGTVVIATGDEPRAVLDFTQTKGWALVSLRSGDVLREGTLDAPPASMVLSPDGRRLAVAGGGQVEVVNLASGRSRTSSDIGVEAESEGDHLAYSGNGALLVSSDSTGRVSLWDGHTANLLGTVAPSDTSSSPVFLPDNHTVRIPAVDGAVHEWDTRLTHAIDFACNVVGNGLTQHEWRQILPNYSFKPTCPDN